MKKSLVERKEFDKNTLFFLKYVTRELESAERLTSQQVNVKVLNELIFKYRQCRDLVADSIGFDVMEKEDAYMCTLTI
jgi:hypothetical protein